MPRAPLTQIAFSSWEHPADRAALNTLRAIPGFDEIVRRIAGWFGERGARQLFTASAVRVGPTQYPGLDALLTEALETLDLPDRPQLYVRQSSDVSAHAVGFDKPFIIVTSEAVKLLDREELRFMLARAAGQILSGQTTYRTIALMALTVGLAGLPFLAGIVLFPFQMALLEWYRKSELSADRAGLLGSQDIRIAQMAFMRMAGGGSLGDATDLDTFMEQSREYELDEATWDKVLKVWNTSFRDNPFATVRAAELQRFVDAGSYAAIIAGDYIRRGAEGDRPHGGDYKDATDFYSTKAREAVSTVTDAISRARDAFSDAFKGKAGT